MNMDVQKFSMVKFVALLVCVLGVGSALAKWDGHTIEKPEQDSRGYYKIANEANLAWLSDYSNKYVREFKYKKMLEAVEADMVSKDGVTPAKFTTYKRLNELGEQVAFTDSAEFKKYVVDRLDSIADDPKSFCSDSLKKALWNKAPYSDYIKSYLNAARNVGNIPVKIDATVTAEYLDMGGYPFIPIAAGSGPARFTGVFEGNGVTIKNLKVDSKEFPMQFYDVIQGYPTYAQNVGLFGTIATGGIVRNVILDNVSILASGKDNVNILTTGSVTWESGKNQVSVGSIVGWMEGGLIDTCFASGTILSNGKDVGAGGIVGAIKGGIIKNALSTASINASGKDVYVGGVVGVIRGSSTVISSVYDGDTLIAHPDVKGAQGALLGRVVEGQTATLTNCFYETGLHEDRVGLVGEGASVVGDNNGVLDNNTERNACILNGFVWTGETCTDPSGIWSKDEHITLNGISKGGVALYLINFDPNGGSFASGAKTTKVLPFGETLTADEIAKPTKDGFSFGGWAFSADAESPATNLGNVYKPHTVYAYWKNTYVITFNANGGKFADKSSVKTKILADGDTITAAGIDDPGDYSTGVGENRRDYKFVGWALTKNASEKANDFGFATKAKTIYAVWAETQAVFYTVAFDAQGHGDEPSPERVEHGKTVAEPSSMTADGYNFGGWYKEPAGENAFEFSSAIISDMTLYAKWTLTTYQLTYNLDGGTNDGDNPDTYSVESPDILLKDPTKEGFDFLGWYYDDDYKNRATQITHGTTGNKTLFAKWKIKTYTISYNAGGNLIVGAGNVLPVEKRYGENISLLGESYQAPWYVQDGWATVDSNETALKDYELNEVYSKNESVTLFPHWKKADYTITYHLDGGVNNPSNPDTYSISDSTTGVVFKDPLKVGSTFAGWYGKEDYSGNKVTKLTVCDSSCKYGDVNLYAKWTPITITVTASAQTCPYDGKGCGAKVTISPKCPTGYTCIAVTDSVKNVAEGAIDAKIVDFTIKDGSGNDVTDAFRVSYVESGKVSVTPKAVTFKGRDTTATFTGEEIHVSSAATSKDLLPGHTHNVGYDTTVTDAKTYKPSMTAAADVKIYDADGNDVTANYAFTDASITSPSKGLTVSPSNTLTFSVIWSDEYAKADGMPISMQNAPTVTAIGGTTEYRYQFEGGAWVTDLSSLTKTAVGNYNIKVEATNSNYTKKADTTVTLHIDSKPVITIVAGSDTKIYDGTPLTKTDGFAVTGELAPGTDEVTDVVIEGSITDVGVAFNKVTGYKVMRGSLEVTSSYNFNLVNGTLTVTPAALTIKTNNASKVYDGTALKDSDVKVSGLKNSETLQFVTDSQTVAGSKVNGYEITGGTAKLSNYTIAEETLGTLTVTPKAATITVAVATKLYGDPEPDFTGTPSGLVDNADLGVIKYYRTNPAVKNVGEYADAITASYTANPNYSVTVVPAKFTIAKRSITLTSAGASKVYDGAALTATTVTVGGDGFASGEGFIFNVTGSQTDAGVSDNLFTYTVKAGTDTAANYTVAAPVFGKLTVTKAPVTVTIAGHVNTFAYSGAEQKVFGYDVTIDNPLYTLDDFSFNKTETADSIVTRTDVGSAVMGLTAALFQNNNPNFDETFNVVSDGSLTITPKNIEVAVGSSSKIYGYPISDSDFKAVTYATGFSENDPIEELLDNCTYSRTPAGNNVGTYTVSVTCPDYGNYKITNKTDADNFKITKRSLILTASAEKTYGEADPTSCSAVLSGFAAGDTATVTECKFDSRVVDGNDVGDYLFTASAAKVDWGTTVAGNYAVGLGSGMLTVNRKDLVVTVADDSISYGDSDPTTYELIFEGLVAGDSKNLIHVDSIRRDAGDYPGTYTVYAYGSAVQGNYNVAYVSGTLKIRADNVVVAWYGFDSAGNPTDSIVVPIFASDVKNDAKIKTKIRTAIAQQGITPTKEEDSDSTYTYNKNWTKQETGKFVAEFTASVKQTEIVVKYGKSKKDTAHIVVDVPRAREDSLVTVDINDGLEKRGISVTTPTSEDSTYVVDYWKKNSDGVYEPVFKGIAKTRPVLVKYGESDDEIVVVNVSLVALRDESLTNKAINDCMDSLDIVPSRSGNYEFTGKWKKTGEDEYEAQFVRYDPSQDMKKIVAKYGDKASDTIAINVYKNATDASIIKAINDTLAARNITPTKANDGEYGFTFDGTWAKNATTKQYEPGFIKSKIVQIVVKYGDAEKDTVKMTINELDSDSIIEKKIEDVLTEISSMPTKEGDSTHVYVLKNFVLNDSTDMYEPVFEKKGRMFGVNFHLPSDGELLAEFNGYVYGEETLLPGAYIVGDTAWKFKGWYQKPNGIGDRYKAMCRTDYGDKDVYPLFQKTIRYETRDGKGVIEVVYTNNATRDIARALEGVIPEDYTKKNVTYTFAGWTEVNGVYKANMADVLSVYGSTRVQSFNVAVEGRALEISGAKLGATLMVFDLNGVLVSKGVVSRGTQRVELSKAGMYIVRVNNQLRRVNVK